MSNQTVENCGFTSTLKKLEFKWSDENDDAEEEKQEEKGDLQHCRVQRRWGKWKVFENWWRIRRRLRRRGAPRLGASNRRAPTSPRSPPWMMNRSTDPKRRRSLVVETKRIEGTRARRLGIDRNRTLKQSLNSRIWSKVWIRSLSLSRTLKMGVSSWLYWKFWFREISKSTHSLSLLRVLKWQ